MPKPANIVVKPRPEPINNTELVTRFRAEGGQILHIRPDNGTRLRGMTIAYKVKGRRVETATACQHGADDFTKKVGTKIAIQHFDEGKTVILPINFGADRLVYNLQLMFKYSGL